MAEAKKQLVIITGLSGAGKTIAMQSFEDMGYFCIDNLPPSLIGKFWELVGRSADITHVCLVVDLRAGDFFKPLQEALASNEFMANGEAHMIFLEASDAALVRRYKETRRSHPLQREQMSTLDAIQKERRLLASLRAFSDEIIDTGQLKPRELRELLMHRFQNGDTGHFAIEVVSFGFKYGLPIDADIVMDVRFLPNPYYVPELKTKTGLDPAVADYVNQQDATKVFTEKFYDLLSYTLPLYEAEGKSGLTIAIGCTGGRHRSVTLAEVIAERLKQDFAYPVHVKHRDMNKG